MTAAASASTRNSAAQIMLMVMLACLPGASALVFFFGWGVVLNLVWLALLAVAIEAFLLKLRGRSLVQLRDCTALVTATLLALALPPTAPWWLGLAGICVSIGIAKHLYGGTGDHILNPAMAGYAALLVAFPLQMTRWLLPEGASDALPSLFDSLQIFLGRDPDIGIDTVTGATALDTFRQERGGQLVSEFMEASPVMGAWSGLGWEWINVGFLMGGLYLVYRRIITWHIPVALLATLFVWALLFHDGGSSASGGAPLFHLFSGGTMLGAFFVATDPVTAPATTRGKLMYGALIGSLVYAIRAWSSYPDGIAFAVLFGNLAAPLIDDLVRQRTQPRFGFDRNWSVTIAVTACVLLAFVVVDITTGMQRPDRERAALSAVMPAPLYDNDLAAAGFVLDPSTSTFTNIELLGLTEPATAYRATLNGQAAGVILPLVAPRGYGGPIELLIGIDADGVITGVRTVQHNESRRLGAALEPGISNWILGFDNRSLANTDTVLWAVKKDRGDFDQFVGATVTPRATVAAVHAALQFFAANKDLLLNDSRP